MELLILKLNKWKLKVKKEIVIKNHVDVILQNVIKKHVIVIVMEVKKAKVIMLPTEDLTYIRYNESQDIISASISDFGVKSNDFISCQHLYFITDDEIKEGDRIYNPYRKDITDTSQVEISMWCDYKKIIATTDESLKLPCLECGTSLGWCTCDTKSLPQPSQAFIEKYCKAGGIDEVLVEYEEYYSEISNEEYNQITQTLGIPFDEYNQQIDYKLKVDSHNTITIHSIKDSWSRNELYAEAKNNYSSLKDKMFLKTFIQNL